MRKRTPNTSTLYPFHLLLLLSVFLFTAVPAIAVEVVNINKADAAAMVENWKGIGKVKAGEIVAHRKKSGPFENVDELAKVKGIGEGLINKNRKYMSTKGGITKSSAKQTSNSAAKTTTKSTSKSTGTAAAANAKSSKKSAGKMTKKAASKSTKGTSNKKPASKNKSKEKKKKKALKSS